VQYADLSSLKNTIKHDRLNICHAIHWQNSKKVKQLV